MQMNTISTRVVLLFGLMVFPFGAAALAQGTTANRAGSDAAARSDDLAYRVAMAKAVRTAAERFLPSIVTVEIIGAATGGGGEVEQDAPTSGVIVDDEGYVIASSIVLRRPSASLLVALPDKSRHVAKVVARDHHRDLVLLKIKTDKELTAVTLPKKLQTRIGATTIAVGRYGADVAPMVSTGVLSAVDRLDGIALQTDARVSPPLYGGALIDLTGNFLGVLIPAVSKGGAPDSTSWYDSGIAFAIPGEVIKKKIERLKEGEDIDRGLIGIVPKSDDPLKDGTELAAVRTRSPAEKAGLKPSDRIVAIDGQNVRRFQQIRQILGRFDAGELIEIEYQRGKKKKTIEVELADAIPPLQPQRLGFIASERVVEDDTQETEEEGEDKEAEPAKNKKTDKKTDDKKAGDKKDDKPEALQIFVDAVIPDSPASLHLKPGDVILRFDGSDISDVQSMRRLMVSAAPKESIKVTYLRDGKESTKAITPTMAEGTIAKSVPEIWQQQSEQEWKVSSLKLPDESNTAAYVGPVDGDDVSNLGLFVLLLNPGDGKPEEVLKSWPVVARENGVVVCAIAPAGNERWRPKEIDVVSRFVASLMKKQSLEKSAVAIGAAGALEGGKPEAADSMALAVAISASERFFGVAIADKARPPAVKLRENEADASLQVLLPIKSIVEMPTWATALKNSGYPIVFGDAIDQEALLKWTRLLQAI